MNLLKFHHSRYQLHAVLISHTTPPHPSLPPPYFLSLPISPTSHGRHSASTVSLFPPISFSGPQLFKFRNPRGSRVEVQVWSGEEEQRRFDASTDHEEAVYQKTLRLVECSMLAAVSGLAYFLSNSLAIEGYFGWFFALPIVISSMRWGLAAGRKTMVRALGAMGYVLVSSFLIRENILALITVNIHASLTYIMTAVGINTIPSMDVIYAIFGTLLMLNCGFFVFLLHILYGVFFARLGMKASLMLPGWLARAI